MKTNIYRLHETILNNTHCRHSGRTLSMCHAIAGEIELGDLNKIVLVTETVRCFDYIIPILRRVLQEHELEIIVVTRYNYIVNDKWIYFRTARQYRNGYGIGEHIVYTDHYKGECVKDNS